MDYPKIHVKPDSHSVLVYLPLDMSAENYGKALENLGRIGDAVDMGEIKGVKIGDKFKNGEHHICEVVDFHEVISMTTGNTISIQAIAKGLNTLAKNTFEVPFATVMRNKIA